MNRPYNVQNQPVGCISTDESLPEVRCPRCDRLWFKGRLIGEIRCRCKFTMSFTVEAKPIDDEHPKN